MRHTTNMLLLLACATGIACEALPPLNDDDKKADPPERIIFQQDGTTDSDIYVMNADGSGPIVDVSRDDEENIEPVFSPNGKRIAFSRKIEDQNWDIIVADADGGNQVNVTSHDAYDGQAAFDPSGAFLAFLSLRDGNQEIYWQSIDALLVGEPPIRFTTNLTSDLDPVWSPDGSRIAWSRKNSDDGTYDVFAKNLDGTVVERLTEEGSSNYEPDFSPDGSKIVFVSERDGDEEIYIMNADGSEPRRLTYRLGPDFSPAFDMTGERIAWIARPSGGVAQIYIMNVDGSDQHVVPNNMAWEWFPDFGPPGSSISLDLVDSPSDTILETD